MHLSSSVGCKPTSVGLTASDSIVTIKKFHGNSSSTNSTSAGNGSPVIDVAALGIESASLLTPMLASACVWKVPVLYEEVDVLSLRFTPVNGPNVSVTDTHPTLLAYPMHSQVTGGTLNLQLTLNSVSTSSYLIYIQVFSNRPFRFRYMCVFMLYVLALCVDQCHPGEQQQCGGLSLSLGSSAPA